MAFPLDESVAEGESGHRGAHDDIHKLLNANTNVQSGTTYTLALTDFGKIVECTSSSAVAVTVPPNSSVAFPVGTPIDVCQMGSGAVTITAGGGVTIRTPATLVLRAQYSTVTLRKRATDEWVLAGDVG